MKSLPKEFSNNLHIFLNSKIYIPQVLLTLDKDKSQTLLSIEGKNN